MRHSRRYDFQGHPRSGSRWGDDLSPLSGLFFVMGRVTCLRHGHAEYAVTCLQLTKREVNSITARLWASFKSTRCCLTLIFSRFKVKDVGLAGWCRPGTPAFLLWQNIRIIVMTRHSSIEISPKLSNISTSLVACRPNLIFCSPNTCERVATKVQHLLRSFPLPFAGMFNTYVRVVLLVSVLLEKCSLSRSSCLFFVCIPYWNSAQTVRLFHAVCVSTLPLNSLNVEMCGFGHGEICASMYVHNISIGIRGISFVIPPPTVVAGGILF